jgi:GH24 family phage-related lysozyme (muramidase)
MKIQELHSEKPEMMAELDFKKIAKVAAAGTAIGAAGLMGLQQSTKGPERQVTTPPAQTQPAEPEKVVKKGLDTDFFADYIAQSEGSVPKVYDDGAGNPTIGIGHLLKSESRGIFKSLFGDKVNYNNIKSGKAKLDDAQIKSLFKYDLKHHLDRTRRIINDFDGLPTYLQAALLDSVYRGDTGRKTAQLMNAGEWGAAAKEYLNRRDYKNRVKLGIRGIGPRMERNRDAMMRYSKELNNK